MSHVYELHREQWIGRSRDEIFEFFSDARNLEALTPPWLKFRILSPAPIPMAAGAEIQYQLAWHGIPVRWKTIIRTWRPMDCFVDVQERGPYALWEHTHTFIPEAGGTRIVDQVRYRLPLGVLGEVAHRLWVRADIERIFDYRASAICLQFAAVHSS